MIELIPSLLVDSHQEFERRLRLVEGTCETVHVDILDGSLFPHTTWFDARAIGALRTKVRYEIHLMVENPLPIVEDWKRHVATVHRAIVHAEMHRPINAVASHLKDHLRLEVGAALNPETPLREAHDAIQTLDQITIMGVHPGQSGQAFLGDMILEKIREIRNEHPHMAIEIDGGLTRELLPACIAAGATRLCAASAIFSAENPHVALKELYTLTSTGGVPS